MIRYALICDDAHEFEAWFSDSAAYDNQSGAGLVECPHCGTTQVRKAVMAPAVAPSRRQAADPARAAREIAGKVRAHIRNNFDYVGDRFADEARAIHAGEKPAPRGIYGETTPEQAKQLADDGVPCSPLPAPFAPAPPKKAN
ncbi:MAG: DUF1178 family protein [Maricaulaceae bacterium]|nr:DUF1178 family protein [Maricaulaceae bacterium]